MEHKLKLVLDQPDVGICMCKMAEKIYEIGGPLAIVAILKGGAYVAYEMLKLLNIIYLEKDWDPHREPLDVIIGHIGLESYGDEMKSQGEVKLMTPLDLSRNDICGRIVIIVDDCMETGNTIEEAKKIIAGYNPFQIRTAVLVDKVTLRMAAGAKEPDIVGWTYLGDGFLVGCGMGAGEKYRGLSELCELEVVNDDTIPW